MSRPNFFILGAPKCGTTSLAAWLGEHPQVFMSPVKEPHFFNTDERYLLTSNELQYSALFANATDEHKAIGEASVWYLHSRAAVGNIEQYSPKARYIVCLRNPIDMAYSLHEQMLVNGAEHVADFEEAWLLSGERAQGRRVHKACREPAHLVYSEVCRLGEQMERLYRVVSKDRVLPVLLDDLVDDPAREYRRALCFLGVRAESRTTFPVLNAAKERRSQFLRRFVVSIGRVKEKLGITYGLGVLTSLDRKNIRFRARPAMPNAIRRQLQSEFEPDIQKLQRLLRRDLSAWLEE